MSFLNSQSDRLITLVQNASLKFAHISAAEWDAKPAPGKWSKKEELGHLIDSAANNHLRFVRAQLAETEYISFAYEQDHFVTSQKYAQRPGEEIAELWKHYNLHLAHVIRNIDPSKLTVTCRIGHYEPVTFEFLIKDYTDHLEYHLRKLTGDNGQLTGDN